MSVDSLILAGPSEERRSVTRALTGLLTGAAVQSVAVLLGSRGWLDDWLPLVVVGALLQGVTLVWAWRSDLLTTRQVLVIALLLRAVAFGWPPVLSDDIWRYLWDGLLQTHGISPFLHEPREEALRFLQGHVAFERMNSSAHYSVYPPLSQMLFVPGAAVARLSGSAWAGVYAIKLTMLLCEIGGLLLLSKLVSARALLLYAWQPLVVIEAAGQAHTEAPLVLLLVATLWSTQNARPALAGAALGAAVWLKLYPLVLLPFLWRRGGWRALIGSVLAITAVAAPYASIEAARNVQASLGLYVGRFEFNAMPYFWIRDLANWLEPSETDMGKLAVGQLLQTLFILLVPVVLLLDWRRRWPLSRAVAVVLMLFFALSTTLHPWYLLGLLALPWVLQRPQWWLLWFATASIGTYLRYWTTLPWEMREGFYLWAVRCAWYGAAIIAVVQLGSVRRGPWLDRIMRHRARRKISRLIPWLADLRRGTILDLGAGEGYVGDRAAMMTGATVILADVVDFRRVDRPLLRYDGRRLPLADKSVDRVILSYVLHHSRDPDAVLSEALRVCRENGRVLILESVFQRPWERRLLSMLDRLANRLRSGGKMNEQELHLNFRPADVWRKAAEGLGARVEVFKPFGRPPHRQLLMVSR